MDKAQVRAAALWLGVPLWTSRRSRVSRLASRMARRSPWSRCGASRRPRTSCGTWAYARWRARHHDKLCRIEVGADEMELAFAHRDEITRRLKELGYLWVSLDLNGLRSGSLNDVLRIVETARRP